MTPDSVLFGERVVVHGQHWCCLSCEVKWRDTPVCPWCGGPGVRWEGTGSEGWPRVTVGGERR